MNPSTSSMQARIVEHKSLGNLHQFRICCANGARLYLTFFENEGIAVHKNGPARKYLCTPEENQAMKSALLSAKEDDIESFDGYLIRLYLPEHLFE